MRSRINSRRTPAATKRSAAAKHERRIFDHEAHVRGASHSLFAAILGACLIAAKEGECL